VKLEKSPPTQKDCRPGVVLVAEIHPELDAFGNSCEISAGVCAPAPTVLDAVPNTDPFAARNVNVTVAEDVPGFTTAIPVDAISVVENNRGKLNWEPVCAAEMTGNITASNSTDEIKRRIFMFPLRGKRVGSKSGPFLTERWIQHTKKDEQMQILQIGSF
jgi:hypothetical protein